MVTLLLQCCRVHNSAKERLREGSYLRKVFRSRFYNFCSRTVILFSVSFSLFFFIYFYSRCLKAGGNIDIDIRDLESKGRRMSKKNTVRILYSTHTVHSVYSTHTAHAIVQYRTSGITVDLRWSNGRSEQTSKPG